MPETDIISGTISQVREWSKGNGYFLVIDGNDSDFYAFGKPKFQAGDNVELEVKEGSGNFSDKMQITKIGKGPGKAAAPAKIAGEEVPNASKYGEIENERYAARQDLIVRQTCMKTAGEVVSHLTTRATSIDSPKALDNVRYIADGLYDWVMRNEPPLPEPTEES